jgi:FMN phosphatase YigB (HAD superfamily)
MPIRCVTFDWGDTLATNHSMPYTATNTRAFTRLAVELAGLGLTVPADWVAANRADMQTAWRASIDPTANPGQQEIDYRAMMDAWVRRIGGDPEDPAIRAARDRCDDLCIAAVIPFTETLPTLMALHGRGLRLGIISHVPWPGDGCRRWFVRHGLAPWLHFYSLSSDVGVIKPHPGHYAHALAQAECAADEILHVGDHPWRDVEGARAAGMRTCLRETEGVYAADALVNCAPDHRILHLPELLELV